VAQPPAAQRVAQAFGPPNVDQAVAPEAAVLQMLILDVNSKIAKEVLSKTRTFETDQAKDDVQSRQLAEEGSADDVKEPAPTSRSFTMDATLGKLFVADLKKQDESFRVVSRPQVRSLIGVAAALDVQGLNVFNPEAAGVGSLNIHVTPKKIDDELVVRTWLSLTRRGKPLPLPTPVSASDGGTGQKFEAESTLKCPLGSTAVMVFGNDQNERSIVVLTDAVSVQEIEQPKQPAVAKWPRPIPRKAGDRPVASADANLSASEPAKRIRLVTLRSIADADVSVGDTVDVFVVVGEGGEAKQQAVEKICESVKVHGSTKSGLGDTNAVTLLVEKEAVEWLLAAELSGSLRLIPHQSLQQASGKNLPRPVNGVPRLRGRPIATQSSQRSALPATSDSLRLAGVGYLPVPSLAAVNGVQASSPRAPETQATPKSEVQQVLDEVREMRKLIQGLRDDMSLLRESVKKPEQRTAQTDVWIHQGDSQVFGRGKRISAVSGHDPAVVEVLALAPDRLWLTGKKTGRTKLKCLFEGETVPESFSVEVGASSNRSFQKSFEQRPSVLVPHAADHLPGEGVSRRQQVGPPEPIAIHRGLRTDIRIQEHHLELIKRDKAISRIAIGSPSIADITQYSAKECGITGLKPGSTTILIWLDSEPEPERIIVDVVPARQAGDTSFSSTGSLAVDAARRQIEEALKKETSIDIDDGTLLDAIRQLHETAGVNIAVDTRALEEEGVSTDARVSIHVAGVSLRSVLKLLLTEHNLAVLIEDEVLKVTSKQRAEGRQTVVMYRVAEFVDQSPDGQAGFDELITLITTVVEPDSWQEVGGNGSVAANLPTGALVIRQTQDVHEQIQQLLSALRNWTKTASGKAELPSPIAVGVDELDSGRFSGFAPIENAQPSLGVPTPSDSPISTGNDSLSEPARHPGNTGAPIEAR
jgi:hypothetical protein